MWGSCPIPGLPPGPTAAVGPTTAAAAATAVPGHTLLPTAVLEQQQETQERPGKNCLKTLVANFFVKNV